MMSKNHPTNNKTVVYQHLCCCGHKLETFQKHQTKNIHCKMRHTFRNCSIVLLLCVSFLAHHNNFGNAKEVEVTKDWQLLGENDTIPAGIHVRMDMTTGEKWVKEIDEDDEETETSTTALTVIRADGSLQLIPKNDDDEKPEKRMKSGDGFYDYELMHRALSRLPEEEKERMGGIPELPQSTGSKTITSEEEREAFEKRMGGIWKQRQELLKELQEQMMDLPKLLKERIKSIKAYLKDPTTHLNQMNLDESVPEGRVTHIVSVLQDLEYHFGDVDMSRDFHTLGGWPLLASLLSENVHVPQNKTIGRLSRRTEGNIRSIQAHAAWAIGTSVKNTEEFFPFAVEPFLIKDNDRTTAIEELIKLFCKNYQDPNSWEIRKLMEKTIYGIGSLLRGNRLAQAHIVGTGAASQLGKVFLTMVSDQFQSAGFKVIQKLLSLAGDMVSDIVLHPDNATPDINTKVLAAFSTLEWCGATAQMIETDVFLAAPVQQTLLETVPVLAPHCAWSDKKKDLQQSIQKIRSGWDQRKTMFDAEHLEQLKLLADQAIQSLEKSG
jgi:hypothetical protein